MRVLKTFTAASVALSMAGSPVLAQPLAAPLSIAGAVSRSSAETDDANALEGLSTVSIVVILAVVLGAILIPEITRPDSP